MRTGKCSKYQRTTVWISFIDLHASVVLIAIADLGHIGKVKFRIHTLGIHIHGNSNNIHITGTLTVSKQSSFYTVSSSQKSHLRIGYPTASVVMGMQGNQHVFSIFQVFADIFDLLCIDMRHGMLYRYRQINDGFSVGCRFPYIQNCIADFQCVFRLSSGETLRAVLKTIIRSGFLGQLLQQFCTFNSNFKDLLF